MVGLTLVPALTACGSAQGGPGSGSIKVVTAFYPLEEAVARVGGDRVTVTDLTPPGAEPHDLELTPSQLGAIADADLVFYLGGGFQPAVEDALSNAQGRAIDVSADLRTLPVPPGDTEASLTADPHVWLDPVLYRRIVDEVERALADASSADRATFEASGAAFDHQLADLDAAYRRGLQRCARDAIVTSHAAFGYLSERYGLHQEAIAGLSPDVEPPPQRLNELRALVERDGITTIFTEDLLPSNVAETIAAATGATTAALNPLESLTPAEVATGADYDSVMLDNLAELRRALGCS